MNIKDIKEKIDKYPRPSGESANTYLTADEINAIVAAAKQVDSKADRVEGALHGEVITININTNTNGWTQVYTEIQRLIQLNSIADQKKYNGRIIFTINDSVPVYLDNVCLNYSTKTYTQIVSGMITKPAGNSTFKSDSHYHIWYRERHGDDITEWKDLMPADQQEVIEASSYAEFANILNETYNKNINKECTVVINKTIAIHISQYNINYNTHNTVQVVSGPITLSNDSNIFKTDTSATSYHMWTRSCMNGYEHNWVDLTGISKSATTYGKTIGFIGGSQCAGMFSKPGNADSAGWMFDLSFPARYAIFSQLGVNITVSATPGAGVAAPECSHGVKNMYRQAKDIQSCDIYVLWPQTNDITGSGSKNTSTPIGTIDDMATENQYINNINEVTYFGGLNLIIDTLLKKNPKCKIYIITPTRCFFDNVWNKTSRGYTTIPGTPENPHLIDYVNAIKEFAYFHGIPCLDMFNAGHTIGNLSGQDAINLWQNKDNGTLHFDNTHFSVRGYESIANKLVNFLAE